MSFPKFNSEIGKYILDAYNKNTNIANITNENIDFQNTNILNGTTSCKNTKSDIKILLAIINQIGKIINEPNVTIAINDITTAIKHLLSFLKDKCLINSIICSYLDSLRYQLLIFLIGLIFIAIVPVNSPFRIFVIQDVLVNVQSVLLGIIIKLYTIVLQFSVIKKKKICLVCDCCSVQRQLLQDNIILLQQIAATLTNSIAINFINTLISQLSTLQDLLVDTCNTIVNDLLKIINFQIQLLLQVIPLVQNNHLLLLEILSFSLQHLLDPIQSLQILIAQFKILKSIKNKSCCENIKCYDSTKHYKPTKNHC